MTVSSVFPLSVLNCCLVLLYAHQKFFKLEEFQDALMAEVESLKLTQHFGTIVFSSKSILIWTLSSYHATGTDHQVHRSWVQSRNSVFQQVLKMPGTTTLIFNGPSVYCSCGIRKSHWNSYHRDLEVAILFQVLSTAYQRNSELRLTLASKRSSQHFLLIPQFDKNHHSSVWAKSVQEVMSQPLQC